MMEEALRGHLLAMAPLAAKIGTRVDWNARSQGDTLPAIVLYLISALPGMNLAGPANWRNDRVQVDSWGRTHKAARDVADIVAAKATDGGLHGLRADFGGVRFRIFVIDRASDTSTDSVGIVHRSRLDLNIWWKPQGD